MVQANRKKVCQYYTRKKFNEKVRDIKQTNLLVGKRGGVKL